jgi:hypothetical protein
MSQILRKVLLALGIPGLVCASGVSSRANEDSSLTSKVNRFYVATASHDRVAAASGTNSQSHFAGGSFLCRLPIRIDSSRPGLLQRCD